MPVRPGGPGACFAMHSEKERDTGTRRGRGGATRRGRCPPGGTRSAPKRQPRRGRGGVGSRPLRQAGPQPASLHTSMGPSQRQSPLTAATMPWPPKRDGTITGHLTCGTVKPARCFHFGFCFHCASTTMALYSKGRTRERKSSNVSGDATLLLKTLFAMSFSSVYTATARQLTE